LDGHILGQSRMDTGDVARVGATVRRSTRRQTDARDHGAAAQDAAGKEKG
jgi:hypothetical protein